MNPDPSCRRGCFIREDDGKFTVVDYPTWTFNEYGMFCEGQNEPLPESILSEQTFDTKEDALRFCEAENLFVCRVPKDKPDDDGASYSEYAV